MENGILRYLLEVNKLERQMYTQRRIFEQLKRDAQRLGVKRNIPLPKDVVVDQHQDNWLAFGWLISAVLVIFEVPFVTAILSVFTNLNTLMIIVLGILSAMFFFILNMHLLRKRAIKKDKKKAKEINLNRQADYLACVSKDNQRIERENIYKAGLKEQGKLVMAEYDKTAQTLARLYSLNVIHPKYRNLVAISSFCEYFETGRCTQLEGHEGAYNIFEQEVRLDRIVTKLDVIAEKLNEIKTSQYYLYQAVREANNTLVHIRNANQKMMESLDSIRENTALIEYNTRCAASNTEAIGNMMVIQELLKQWPNGKDMER